MEELHSRLTAGEVLVGPFSVSGSPTLVETIGYAGFDFVIIDCEHSATSPLGSELEGLIRAAYASGVSPLVRVTNNDRGQILKALNLGAQAVIVPHVNTVDEARRMVSSGKYAPIGTRSSAPPVRAARHGFTDWGQFYRDQQEGPLLIPLIEERAGLSVVEEIAKVPGIGGIFFGPFDLAVSQGNPDSVFDPETHAEERRMVYEAARRQGLPVVDLAWDLESARMMVQLGAQIIALGTDVTMFANSCRDLRVGIERDLKPQAAAPVGR